MSSTRTKRNLGKTGFKPFNVVKQALGFTKHRITKNLDYVDDPNMPPSEKEFHAASNQYVEIKEKVSAPDAVQVYALYKQATVGDCNIARPLFSSKRKVLKYMAWMARTGMPPEEASKRYIKEIQQLSIQINQEYPDFQRKKSEAQQPKLPNSQAATQPRNNANSNPRFPLMQQMTLDSVPGQMPQNLVAEMKGKMKGISRERASLELNALLFSSSTDVNVQNGVAYIQDPAEESKAIRNRLLSAESSSKNRKKVKGKKSLVRPARPFAKPAVKKNSSLLLLKNPKNRGKNARATLRSQFLPSEAEFKRFTLMKMNSVNLTQFSKMESVISFTKNSYKYDGPPLSDIIADAKHNNDRVLAKSNLIGYKKAQGAYTEVLPLIHRLQAEYAHELEQKKPEVKTEFAVQNAPKIELDLFMFRLVRYMDKWFEDPPGINSAGCRSTLITYIYIKRLKKELNNFSFTKNNVHKLLSVCMLLAAKFCEDFIIANKYWAQVAGLSIDELNSVEQVFCGVTDFDLYVSEVEIAECYQKYQINPI